MRRLIRRMGEEKAIIFSTHILEEVDAACSRAMIIDQGRVKADGKPEELRAKDPDAGCVVVTISGLQGSGIRSELEKLNGADTVAELRSSDISLEARITPAKSGGGQLGEQIFNLCRDRGLTLQQLSVEEGRLDNMFHALTVPDTEIDETPPAPAPDPSEQEKSEEGEPAGGEGGDAADAGGEGEEIRRTRS